MTGLSKREIERIRKVNEFKRIVHYSSQFKLAYYEGGDLVLLRWLNGQWIVFDRTGRWFDFDIDRELIQ